MHPSLRQGVLQPRLRLSLSTLSTPTSSPQTIFSGIQPTGIPHLGNYLGALRQWVSLQNSSPASTRLLFCVVDLHALTIKQHPSLLRQWKKETLATLLAIGLDPRRSTLFYQSDVPAHAELHWLLSCSASMGYLSRMTQWKSKLSLSSEGEAQTQTQDISPLDAVVKQKLKLGLFSYPVLQAADILVHGTTHVPVGEDQVQHIEFARECAGNFNALYAASEEEHGHGNGDVLVKPTAVLGSAKRVMNLKEPGVKMSKSAADPATRILLTDEKDVIEKKIRHALTDSLDGVSYDVEQRPGVSNLVDMLLYLSKDGVEREELLDELRGVSLKGLKVRVANELDAALAGIRARIKQLMSEERILEDVAQEGAAKARDSAAVTLEKVKRAVGLW